MNLATITGARMSPSQIRQQGALAFRRRMRHGITDAARAAANAPQPVRPAMTGETPLSDSEIGFGRVRGLLR